MTEWVHEDAPSSVDTGIADTTNTRINTAARLADLVERDQLSTFIKESNTRTLRQGFNIQRVD